MTPRVDTPFEPIWNPMLALKISLRRGSASKLYPQSRRVRILPKILISCATTPRASRSLSSHSLSSGIFANIVRDTTRLAPLPRLKRHRHASPCASPSCIRTSAMHASQHAAASLVLYSDLKRIPSPPPASGGSRTTVSSQIFPIRVSLTLGRFTLGRSLPRTQPVSLQWERFFFWLDVHPSHCVNFFCHSSGH